MSSVDDLRDVANLSGLAFHDQLGGTGWQHSNDAARPGTG